MAGVDERNIVLARLETMPSDMSLSIGNFGSMDKWKLIEHVKKEDDVGRLVVEVYMAGLRSFKER